MLQQICNLNIPETFLSHVASDVQVLDGRQTRLEQIKTQSMRPSDMVEIKKRLGDPKYVPMQLRMSNGDRQGPIEINMCVPVQ